MYTSKWIVGKDSMKRYCRTRKSFTAAGQWKISGMLATNMRKESEISKYKTSENITSISTEWCITFDWYIRKFPQQTHRNILAWCCTTFDVTAYHGGHDNFWRHSITMAGMKTSDGTVLAWRACLKKTEVELELLTDVDILLMVEKSISGMPYIGV